MERFGSILKGDPPLVEFAFALDHPFFKDLEYQIVVSKNIDKSKSYFIS
jgi:hypothetical protein